MAEPPSSPPGEATSAEDALQWYKQNYELLESELIELRDSSKELEQELEKDIERAEKQERVLREQAETLAYECEEWKVGFRRSQVLAGRTHDADFAVRRGNTRTPRRRRTRRKTHSRRRSRPSASRAERCS